MKELLQDWLQRVVGLYVEMDSITRYTKDGFVFIGIFKYYDVISISSIKNISHSNDDAVCRNNLKQLKIWFKLVDIDFTDEVIEGIINGNSKTCFSILYQLFSVLENKKALNLVAKQKERCIRKQVGGPFTVSEISLPNIEEKNAVKYSDILQEHQHLIDWYGRKCKYMKKERQCNNYSSMLSSSSLLSNIETNDASTTKSNVCKSSNNDVSVIKKKSKRYNEDAYYVRHELHQPGSSLSIDDGRSTKQKSGTSKKTLKGSNCPDHFCSGVGEKCHFLPPISSTSNVTSNLPLHVQQYLKRLKTIPGFPSKKHQVKRPVHSLILQELLADFRIHEEQDIKDILSHKLVKQSNVEKEMSMKLFTILTQNAVFKQGFIELQNRMKNFKDATSSLLYKTVNNRLSTENADTNEVRVPSDTTFNSIIVEHDSLRYMDEDYQAYFKSEKKRTVDLHRKLYAEKLKLRFVRHYTICYQTLEDIIDLAIRQSEFNTAYGIDAPDRLRANWKCLFYHGLPIFDVESNIETILFSGETDCDASMEILRQDTLNENSLEMYLKVIEFWEFIIDSFSGDELDTNLRSNIYNVSHESQILLGHIVHLLLEAKYPSAAQPKPADIPKYPVRAVVDGMSSEAAVQVLKSLFLKTNILIVDVASAVNFSLQAYKDLVKKNPSAFQQLLRTTVVHEKSDELLVEEEKEHSFKEACTQTTSSLFFEVESDALLQEEIIGHDLFNMILSGSEVPSSLLVNAIIRYIKKHDNIKGWLLLNFPSTLYQASELEFALSSKKFPYNLEDDSRRRETEGGSFPTGKDSLNEGGILETEIKGSRIVPNPTKYNIDDTFKTYLSAYVSCVKGMVPNNSSNSVDCGRLSKNGSESTLLLDHPEKEGVPTVQMFYRDQGIAHNFIYEKFDLNTLKLLGRIILAPYFEELKPQMPIDDLLAEFEPTVNIRWAGNEELAGNTDDLNQKVLTNQSPSEFVTDESGIAFNESPENKQEEPNWNFCNFPIPETVKYALATYWETLESTYINSYKCLSLVRRNNDYAILPYLVNCLKSIKLYLFKDDDRQIVVSTFLETYNGLHKILRSDIDIINELHVRVMELKDALIGKSKNKEYEAAEMVKALIQHNRSYHELVMYANYCLSLLQIEADRCTRTIDFLKDYYMAMLEIYSADSVRTVKVPVMENCTLKYSDVGSEEEEVFLEDRVQIENSDPLYLSLIEELLNYGETGKNTGSLSPIPEYFETKANSVRDDILDLKNEVYSMISKQEETRMRTKDDTKNKMTANKASSRKKSRQAVSSELPVTEVNSIPESEETKELTVGDIFQEWRLSVKNEVDRFNFRVKLLTQNFCVAYDELINLVGNKISNFYEEVKKDIFEECDSIEELCKIFQMAIEEKTPIYADIVFKRNKFYTIETREVTVAPAKKLPPALEEMLLEESFTIKQLEALKDHLMFIAPSGVIAQEAFVEFIDNIISHSFNKDILRLVPNIWKKLRRKDVVKLSRFMFGDMSMIVWREFFVYCLDLPYPLTEEILDAKLQFKQYDINESEIISYSSYMKTTLWFQRELPENPLHALRNVLAKEFLFCLFKLGDDSINYTALLMSFCKDVDEIVGCGKLMSLVYGRCVIVYEEDLFLERILTDNNNVESRIVTALLNEIIDDVIRFSSSEEREAFVNSEYNYDAFSIFNAASKDDTNEEMLTESMYHQFFRRQLVYQWTSKIPSSILSDIFTFAFTSVYMLGHEFVRPDVMDKAHTLIEQLKTSDADIPQLMSLPWVKHWVHIARRFKALSFKHVIKSILHEQAN